jgi:hypothetical protein
MRADTGSDARAKYVPRTTDTELASALTEAPGDGHRLVLVIGDSASGKSRSAAEMVRRDETLSGRALLVPRRDGGLSRLLDHGIRLDEALIWLDDLDKHLARGLDPDVIRRVLDESPSAVIVATIRRSQLQTRQQSLEDPAWQLLTDEQVVRHVHLEAALDEAELAGASKEFSNPSLLAALERGVGLGEYLVGGPELVKRMGLASGLNRHLADTVVSWYRTGLRQPIPEPDLRRLWTETLPGSLARPFHGRRSTDQDDWFNTACAWACEPIMSRDAYEVALVTAGCEGYEASDYVVDHMSRQADRPAIAQAVWQAAFETADRDRPHQPERLWAVAIAAHDEQQSETALSAMQVLADLGHWGAAFNVGVLLGQLGRGEEAIGAYEEVVTRFGEAPEAAVREQVAMALRGKGVGLGQLGRGEEEIGAYEEVVTRFGEAPEAAVREVCALARTARGELLG